MALYAYAVLPAAAPPPLGDSAILPGAAPWPLPAGPLSALVSEVDRGCFEDGPGCRMAEPDWVAARAAGHHAVIAAAAALGPTLPLAFGALFSGPDRLRAWLTEHAESLRAGLDQVAGCAEWSLTLTGDAVAQENWLDAHDPALRSLAEQRRLAPPGTAFLLARRLDRARIAARHAQLAEAGAAVGDILAEQARASRAEPSRQALAAWTALVPEAGLPPFRARLDALAARLGDAGLALTLSGPWPAYGFAREALRDA
jgi:hypothetical protein